MLMGLRHCLHEGDSTFARVPAAAYLPPGSGSAGRDSSLDSSLATPPACSDGAMPGIQG